MINFNALVVKLVDTTDLKSVPFWSASSSLAEGTKNNFNLKILRSNCFTLNYDFFLKRKTFFRFKVYYKDFIKFINALVVKLVDTKNLKSLPLVEYHFKSVQGQQN